MQIKLITTKEVSSQGLRDFIGINLSVPPAFIIGDLVTVQRKERPARGHLNKALRTDRVGVGEAKGEEIPAPKATGPMFHGVVIGVTAGAQWDEPAEAGGKRVLQTVYQYMVTFAETANLESSEMIGQANFREEEVTLVERLHK